MHGVGKSRSLFITRSQLVAQENCSLLICSAGRTMADKSMCMGYAVLPRCFMHSETLGLVVLASLV